MPAKNLFHNTVKTALAKDGWTITDEHLFIQVEDVDFYIDLTAERILAAEKTGKKNSSRDKILFRSLRRN
ncbi:element excision factor XisH family protein [Plectonema radiosum]|uniref:element excision factor XisH family protein n=1 Tax=Plectonema radiosum TaxID=945768 RepID=UPI0029814574|nr:element excision factor XisH family protein [Plectonema radiosum]